MSDVVRAVGAGATTIKAVIDATGLSRLKVERALQALEKQKLLVRDHEGFRAPGKPATASARHTPPARDTTTPSVRDTTIPSVRECGSCSACCTLLEVEEVGTAVNEWCRHCEAGKGCTIYDSRPQMCRSFSCAWLQGHLGDEWFPENAGMVVHFSQDAVNVQVDPAYADRWQQEPFFSKLREWSLKGITRSGNRGYATLIAVGYEKFLLLGRTIVPDPTLFGTAFLPVAAETFRYWKARSQEHLQRLHERIAEIQRIREEFGYCAIPDDEDPYPPYRPALLRLSRISTTETS